MTLCHCRTGPTYYTNDTTPFRRWLNGGPLDLSCQRCHRAIPDMFDGVFDPKAECARFWKFWADHDWHMICEMLTDKWGVEAMNMATTTFYHHRLWQCVVCGKRALETD